MIEELTRRLRTHLIGNATLVSLTSGIYTGRAPQNAAYGYVTFWPFAENARHLHTEIVEDTFYQIDIWHTSMIGLSSIHQEIRNSLDSQVLALGTLSEVGVVRQGSTPLIVDHVDETGAVYHQALEYQILVQ